jgi:[protein-PII] uridylyltransferase
MSFVFKGTELIAVEPLGADDLTRLAGLAARRPLRINGASFSAQELENLAAEARRQNEKIRLGEISSSSSHDQPLPASLHQDENKFFNSYQTRVAAHAARRFSSAAPSIERVNQAQTFLKIEDRRLRFMAQLGAGGLALANARSFCIDTLIRSIFHLAASEARIFSAPPPLAVVALGGYGRGELAPASDVDVLFLRAENQHPALREMIERILQMLWDARLDIGSFNYTTAECVAAARADAHLQTALLSTRFIVGDERLYQSLRSTLEAQRRKTARALLEIIKRERRARYQKFSPTVAMLEPNVKESAGGLRDLHTALWAARVALNARSLEELRAQNFLSDEEYRRVRDGYDFLWRVRFEMHWLAGRKTDRLAFELQSALAQKFGCAPTAYLLASERFMRDYYRRASAVHSFCERICAHATEMLATDNRTHPSSSADATTRFARWLRNEKSRWRKANSQQGAQRELFSIRRNQVHFDAAPGIIAAQPHVLFDALALAQSALAPLDAELRAVIRAHLPSLGRAFRESKASADGFLKCLRARGRAGFALRLMHETELLARYLPEFARITHLVQHDFYHQYTIDEHTLRAVEALDELAGDARAGVELMLHKTFDEIEDAALVYLAVLFHDLGKGRGRGHIARGAALAQRICARMQLDEAQTRKVARLVANHVLMAQVSQRRDLSEPSVIENFIAQTGGRDELDMLFLLTYADMRAVGVGVWNEWKGALLCELYTRARRSLSSETSDFAPRLTDARALIEQTVRAFERLSRDAVEPRASVAREAQEHLALLPKDYALTADASAIALHLCLIRELGARERAASQAQLIFHWHDAADGATASASQLTIVARDRRGLFADLAGALAASGIEILSANLHTRRDSIAVDTFVLREAARRASVEIERRPKVEQLLAQAASGELDTAAAVERWRTRHAPRQQKLSPSNRAAARARITPQVNCSNHISATKTVVEVHAPDEHGLAYQIARTLAELDLDISRAKIATERSDALDVFYVTTNDGAKLSEAEMQRLKETLIERLNE